MSTMESDGIDEVLQGVTQVALTAAARMGERLARVRQQAALDAQERSEQAAREYDARLRVERAAAQAALAPVHRSDWWDTATRQDVTQAYETATAWRQTDPEAEGAHARIVEEARTRFGVELGAEQAMGGRGSEAPEAGAGQQTQAEDGRVDGSASALTLTAEEEVRRARSVAIFRDDFGMGQEEAEQLADEQVRQRRAAAADRSAQEDRTEAGALIVQADVLDRVAEAADPESDGRGAGADLLRGDAELAWDSAERRAALAATLDQVENRTAVNARLAADVAQSLPATAAVEGRPRPGGSIAGQRKGRRTGARRNPQHAEHGR